MLFSVAGCASVALIGAGAAAGVAGVAYANGELKAATMWFMQNALAKPDNAGAGSTDFMHLFGLVALGYMWARIAEAALAKKAAAVMDRPLSGTPALEPAE